MQLVEKSPEMPEEIELNKDRRNQLAELMLEYPTKADEKENLTREQTDEKSYYTCQNCKKAFGAIRGKLNHLGHNPKCGKVPQKEEFVTKCQDCSRTFSNPSGLKKHRKYICTQQEAEEMHVEPTYKEQTRQTTQYLPLMDATESREEEEEEEDEEGEDAQQGETEATNNETERKKVKCGKGT